MKRFCRSEIGNSLLSDVGDELSTQGGGVVRISWAAAHSSELLCSLHSKLGQVDKGRLEKADERACLCIGVCHRVWYPGVKRGGSGPKVDAGRNQCSIYPSNTQDQNS